MIFSFIFWFFTNAFFKKLIMFSWFLNYFVYVKTKIFWIYHVIKICRFFNFVQSFVNRSKNVEKFSCLFEHVNFSNHAIYPKNKHFPNILFVLFFFCARCFSRIWNVNLFCSRLFVYFEKNHMFFFILISSIFINLYVNEFSTIFIFFYHW